MQRTTIDAIWEAVNSRLQTLGAKPATAGEVMAARDRDRTVDPDEIAGRVQDAKRPRQEVVLNGSVVQVRGSFYSPNTIGEHGG